MRLVRLAQQPSRVADDIRAALASIGRGSTVVGGVALIGVRPPGSPGPVDAVVVLPRGVLVVVGVDLPDPAMRLEAPLTGQWKADGWPLVGTDEAQNPAAEALATSEAIARRLREAEPATTVTGTIVAVGPYVETVEQPPADLSGTVRVLHPTPTAMLAATVSLASASRPASVTQARAMLEALAPDAPKLSDEVLAAEGFAPAADADTDARTTPVAHPLNAVPPTVPADHPQAATVKTEHPKTKPAARAKIPATPLKPVSVPPPVVPRQPSQPVQPSQPPKPSQPTKPSQPAQPPRAAAPPPMPPPPAVKKPSALKQVKWLPFAAVTLLAGLLISAVLVASSQSGDDSPDAQQASPSAAPPATGQAVNGISFTELATDSGTQCTPHAFGDTKTALAATPCSRLRRASFEATVDGRRAAVTVAIADFSSPAQADTFKQFVDTPGNGGITDLATETAKWTGPAPTFSGAAYASVGTQGSVRVVQACWLDEPSTSDDPGLGRAATAALDLPLPE